MTEMQMRDWARSANAGDVLITPDDHEPGDGDRYGLGDYHIDMIETLLRARGLTLESEPDGLVAREYQD